MTGLFLIIIAILIGNLIQHFSNSKVSISKALLLGPCWIALWILLIISFKVELKSFYVFLFISTSSYFFYQYYVMNPYRKPSLKSHCLDLYSPNIKLDSLTFENIRRLKEKLRENGYKKIESNIILNFALSLTEEVFKLKTLIIISKNNVNGKINIFNLAHKIIKW